MKLLFSFLFMIASQILLAKKINLISDADTASTLHVVWKFKTNGKINSSSCADKDFIYFGSEDGNLYALNKLTGMPVWKYHTNGKINSSPMVSGSKLFFLSMDGFFYSLDASTGKLIWKFKTGGEKKIDVWDYYLSDPVADKNLVYFGSTDSSVYALQLETGKLQWSYKTEGSIHAKPVLHNDTLFVGNFSGYFCAFNAHDGNMIWKFRTIGDAYFPKGELQRGALYYDKSLWFGSRDYNLYALNPNTGRGVWNMKENGSWIIATPAANGKYVYFGTSDSHAFYCIDITTGETKWKLKMNMRMYGSASFLDGIVFFGCFNGKLYGADELTGKIKYEFKTEGCKQNYYSVYDSTDQFKKGFSIYGNTLQEYEAAEAKIMSLGSITSTPLIIDCIIYFGSTDGYFYAVKK